MNEPLFKIYLFDTDSLSSIIEKRFNNMNEAVAWCLDHQKDVPLLEIEQIEKEIEQ